MSSPPIPKINEQNEIIGETTIGEAVENGWPRRIVRIFVFDTEGNILIHRRSDVIIGYPCMWDQAAGGHIDIGEGPLEAAARETHEEVGIDAPLSLIAEAHYTAVGETPVFNYVYKAIVPAGTHIAFDTHEISEVRWLSAEELDHMVKTHADMFVPGFLDIWAHFRDKLITI